MSTEPRKKLLLKIVTLGQLEIDPDSPGTTARAVIFGIGTVLILVGLVFIILDKLRALQII
jgi:hypothetical protein